MVLRVGFRMMLLEDGSVVGFGDDVPAFLLRPVPKKAMGG